MVTPRDVYAADPKASSGDHYVMTNGERRSADEAYDALHDTGEAHPLRAAFEMGLMLGGGTAWYWVTRESNQRDWDPTDVAGRFDGSDWRYDNNGLDVNFLFHGLSGTAYYGIARANHLSVPVAYAYAFGSSFLWEFALEFNERISISDALVTPSAGLVIGEYLHRVSWYLNRFPAPRTARHDWLRWSPIGASVAIHRAWEGADDPVVRHTDHLGYDADLYHRFAFDAGVARGKLANGQQTWIHSIAHRGELHALPGFLRPGTHSRFFARADFSFMDVEATFSQQGAGIDLQAEAMLLGWFGQQFADERHGEAHVVGVNLAHRYLNNHATGQHDFYGVLHLPGPGFDLWAREWPIGVRLSARGNFDFAGVGSQAYPLWREQNPGLRTKNVLAKQHYYIGWGYSARLRSELSLGPLDVAFSGMAGHYDSHEGLDRAQDEVEVDLEGEDDLAEWSLEAGCALTTVEQRGWGLRLGGELSERTWHSRAGEFRSRARTRVLGGNLRLTF